MGISSKTSENNPNTSRARLVPRGKEDVFSIKKIGSNSSWLGDMYIRLLSASWRRLLELIAFIYLFTNIFFALAYLSIGDGIENAKQGSFMDAFFFSVQTLSTIGYGKMAPVGLVANLLVTLEVLTGFVFFAVTTGVIFAKFSRPTARVLFSNVAVICQYNGKPHLMIRLANERSSRIVDANIHLVLLRKETSQEGNMMRRFVDIPLVRNRAPILQLSWTLMHTIDETSPFYNVTEEILQQWDAEVLVSLVGLDETFSQTIHARHSYITDDIICNAVFVDVMNRNEEDNSIEIDYKLFHEFKRL